MLAAELQDVGKLAGSDQSGITSVYKATEQQLNISADPVRRCEELESIVSEPALDHRVVDDG
jgi:hypothetical protein